MEFNRLFNIFTVSAIIVLLVTAFVTASFTVLTRAESNLGVANNYEYEKNNQVTDAIF